MTTTADPNATTSTPDPNATTTADPNATTTTDPNATTSTADPNATTTEDPNASTTSQPWTPYDKIWSTNQCSSILWFDGITLSQCQDFCTNAASCTAINFGEDTGHCTLLNCGYPCPEPQWTAPNYKGYCYLRGKLTFSVNLLVDMISPMKKI